MRRTLLWATLALYPALAIVLGASGLDALFASGSPSNPMREFLEKYWWGILAMPAVALTIFFLGHALRNTKKLGVQRYIWAVGIFLTGPLVIPVYWWHCSDAI